MSEVIYELKHPFEYSSKGEKVPASFITLFAPTFKQIDKVAPIKQAFTAAITELTDSVESGDSQEEAGDITGPQVLQLMYRWSGDMTKIFLHSEQLFKSGAALVDGEAPLTTPLMEKMNLTDFEGLLGAYIANFIVPSLMDGL